MPAALLLRAEMAELPRLTEWVDGRVEALDLNEPQAYALRLCIDELAGNVLMHSGAQALRVTVGAPPLILLIEDDGPEFDPGRVADPALPASLDEARPGGLGLMLARRWSRGMDYARVEGWNRVSVAF
jgi:serine/threonine-protein kinase RsbW